MNKKLESVNVIMNVATITKINKMYEFRTQVNMFTRNYYDTTLCCCIATRKLLMSTLNYFLVPIMSYDYDVT